MKHKARKLIHSILIGAVATLYHTDAKALELASPSMEGFDGEDAKDAVSALKRKTIKNVLKITSTGDTKLIAGHRSHMSHRSGGGGGGGHYSHVSHYSSYGGGGSSHSSHSSHSSSSYAPAPKPAPKTYKTYDLGDRTLSAGLYGKDVSELTSLLVKKKYLNSSWITMQKGYSVYNARVVDAVKRFQKDAGKKQDGIVTSSLVDDIRSWDANKTTLVLGIRDLSYDQSNAIDGKDVDELIALLRSAGFAPDPAKLQYNNGKAIFTADIAIAVKLFQAYNELAPTGNVDAETIAKLKSKQK